MRSLSRITLYAAVVIFLFEFALVAQAAPLSYTEDTTVQLSSPSVQLIIKSGSKATSLVVNDGNIVVNIPAYTAFNLTSASRDLTITPDLQRWSNFECLSGVATLTVSAESVVSQTLTITPTSAQCKSASLAPAVSGGGASSGGGGGSNFYTAPPPTPLIKTATTTTTTITTPVTTSTGAITTTQPPQNQLPQTKFVKDIIIGSKGDDAKSLQSFLMSKNVGAAARALSAYGATGNFGAITRKALAEFQASVGIKPATGYFGPKTRAYLNKLR